MQDYYIPRKFGSKQIYGENGGPGGAFHTWRQVPPMLKIAHTMEEVCPNAWLLNYSNPLPRVTGAICRATKIKTVGLCHGVGSGMVSLAAILGTELKNLDFISTGLNHFYWFIKVNAKNDFKMDTLGPHPATDIKSGADLISFVKERGITWAIEQERPLIEEILRTYGYLTYPSESHPGEYIPWADAYCPYVKYDFDGFRKQGLAMKEKLDQTLAGTSNNYWWVHASGERAIQIILGIENDTKQRERALNLPNKGFISNLPEDIVVEIPGYVDKDGIHGDYLGKIPRGVAQLLQHEAAIQDLVIEAAITGNKDIAIQALSLDGTLPSPAVARNLFDEMYRVQKQYLPQFTK
jgi:alpha-galactosidase